MCFCLYQIYSLLHICFYELCIVYVIDIFWNCFYKRFSCVSMCYESYDTQWRESPRGLTLEVMITFDCFEAGLGITAASAAAHL